MALVSATNFKFDFLRKIFLMLYSVNWSSFIVWLNLLLAWNYDWDIRQYLYVVISFSVVTSQILKIFESSLPFSLRAFIKKIKPNPTLKSGSDIKLVLSKKYISFTEHWKVRQGHCNSCLASLKLWSEVFPGKLQTTQKERFATVAVEYCSKALHLRCFWEFWIRLW